MFPAVRLGDEYCGDGSMRQIAPISPALHLGADRVLVVGTGRQGQSTDLPAAERKRGPRYPSIAQIAGHALNSIFLDTLAQDIEWLERINQITDLVPADERARRGLAFRRVEVLVMQPSEPIEHIALRHVHELPRSIRFLFGSVGAMARGGANLASYLLFEPGFTHALIELGFRDTLARRHEILAHLASTP
jgi:NTE family protein